MSLKDLNVTLHAKRSEGDRGAVHMPVRQDISQDVLCHCICRFNA